MSQLAIFPTQKDYSLPKKTIRMFMCNKDLFAGKNGCLHAFVKGKTYQQERTSKKEELVLISEIAQHHRVTGEWEQYFEVHSEKPFIYQEQ